jgi:hypothetical protein
MDAMDASDTIWGMKVDVYNGLQVDWLHMRGKGCIKGMWGMYKMDDGMDA